MNLANISGFQKLMIVLGGIVLGYLFFTQLFWKMPPGFGCSPDFAFTTGQVNGGRVQLQRTSGLCDWIGVEAFWSSQPRPILVTDMRPVGGPLLAVRIDGLARLNGIILNNLIMPNIRWMGWVIWGGEAFIFVSLFFGLFTRLGALTAIGISAQLWVGLAGISTPFEWEWSYNLILLLSILMFAFPPGRYFGVDTRLRPIFAARAEQGNKIARALLLLS